MSLSPEQEYPRLAHAGGSLASSLDDRGVKHVYEAACGDLPKDTVELLGRVTSGELLTVDESIALKYGFVLGTTFGDRISTSREMQVFDWLNIHDGKDRKFRVTGGLWSNIFDFQHANLEAFDNPLGPSMLKNVVRRSTGDNSAITAITRRVLPKGMLDDLVLPTATIDMLGTFTNVRQLGEDAIIHFASNASALYLSRLLLHENNDVSKKHRQTIRENKRSIGGLTIREIRDELQAEGTPLREKKHTNKKSIPEKRSRE